MAVTERVLQQAKVYDIENSIKPGDVNFEKTATGKLGIHLGKVDNSEFFAIEKDDLDAIIVALFK